MDDKVDKGLRNSTIRIFIFLIITIIVALYWWRVPDHRTIALVLFILSIFLTRREIYLRSQKRREADRNDLAGE